MSLTLKIEGTIFGQAIPVVREELRRSGITKLEPVFYISTGYGCIAGQPLIALGFYDFHPLVKRTQPGVSRLALQRRRYL